MSFKFMTIVRKELEKMDKKDFLLDLYEIEMYKKSIYEDGIGTNQPKPNREEEFGITIKNVAIINQLLDMLEKS